MPNLSYFRGSPGGTGVPAGFGQATNTGMAAGLSKGMDALAKGLEKFFENKREQAEEDAYAELLEKLNELPGKTKEVGRKTSGEVMSAATEGTENLPEYLTKAAAEGHIEPIPGSGWSGDNSGFYTPHGPMPVDSSSVGTKQEMVPNPEIEGMLYDAESGEYYPHSVLPSGEFETITYPDGITDYVAGTQPAPQMIPGPMVPDFSSSVPLERPMPGYRATEAGMAGQQVPLSFAEQDQARNQLIAEYARRIGTDRAEKLMGEQFKTHRDAAGNPIAYSLGKSLQMAPKTDPAYTTDDFIEIEVGGVKGALNRRDGTIKLPTQEGALEEGITALKQMKKMNRTALVAMKEAGTTEVYFDPDDKVFKDAKLDSRLFRKHPKIKIEKAIAAQTTEEPATLSRGAASDLLHNR